MKTQQVLCGHYYWRILQLCCKWFGRISTVIYQAADTPRALFTLSWLHVMKCLAECLVTLYYTGVCAILHKQQKKNNRPLEWPVFLFCFGFFFCYFQTSLWYPCTYFYYCGCGQHCLLRIVSMKDLTTSNHFLLLEDIIDGLIFLDPCCT